MPDEASPGKNISVSHDGLFIELSSVPLPNIIRYYDDFADKTRTIRSDDNIWKIICDGRSSQVIWTGYSVHIKGILQRYIAWGFTKYDPSTFISIGSVINAKKEIIQFWINVFNTPDTARNIWENDGFGQLVRPIPFVLRSISVFLCEMSLCGWSPDDLEYLRGWKWFSPKAKSNVEHGLSYYLSQNEETKIVSYFDRVATAKSSEMKIWRNALLLYFSYAFGLRPVQIAGLKHSDVNIIETSGRKVGHITFYQSKQRSGKREPILRKIKSEWVSIAISYRKMSEQMNEERTDLVSEQSFLNLTPSETSMLISTTAEEIIGRPITPTIFRHIAAQRMADLGMSQLELAEFLGHSDVDTCLVYFENSAVQGQVVNRALGLSPIYQKLRDIAEHGFINQDELDGLSGDQQVGGAAHGIPLAGIGGCTIGQSLCELSPAISCYTCPKFLPLQNIETHKNVAEDLQEVIVQFERSGRNDQSNPAYTQLTHTMTKISSIIESLEPLNE